MKEVTREGILIDTCTQCRGVWLDRGELDKIIERSVGAQVAAPMAPPVQTRAAPVYQPEPRGAQGQRPDDRRRHDDDDDDNRGGYRKKRKDSFLSDIFDF